MAILIKKVLIPIYASLPFYIYWQIKKAQDASKPAESHEESHKK
jgi:hypothetical protein